MVLVPKSSDHWPPLILQPLPTRGFFVESLMSISLRKVQPYLSLALDVNDGNSPCLNPVRSGETAGIVDRIWAGEPAVGAAREVSVGAFVEVVTGPVTCSA
ncbi:unannotated protein [freshwater metagenome]|uniref:Unannotated protein n=1 Tax=freshwater metagenome TaxID=449393 RepID=A0A6J7HCL6_9ZZZZ